jgi:hypothetical protein
VGVVNGIFTRSGSLRFERLRILSFISVYTLYILLYILDHVDPPFCFMLTHPIKMVNSCTGI